MQWYSCLWYPRHGFVTFLLVGNTPAIVNTGDMKGHVRKMSKPVLRCGSDCTATESKGTRKIRLVHFPTILVGWEHSDARLQPLDVKFRSPSFMSLPPLTTAAPLRSSKSLGLPVRTLAEFVRIYSRDDVAGAERWDAGTEAVWLAGMRRNKMGTSHCTHVFRLTGHSDSWAEGAPRLWLHPSDLRSQTPPSGSEYFSINRRLKLEGSAVNQAAVGVV